MYFFKYTNLCRFPNRHKARQGGDLETKGPLHQTINSDAAVPFKIQILFCLSPFAGIAASHGSVLL